MKKMRALTFMLIFCLNSQAAVDALKSRETNFKKLFSDLDFKPFTPMNGEESEQNSRTTFNKERLYLSLEDEEKMKEFLSDFYAYANIDKKQSKDCDQAYRQVQKELKPAKDLLQKQQTLELMQQNKRNKCDLFSMLKIERDIATENRTFPQIVCLVEKINTPFSVPSPGKDQVQTSETSKELVTVEISKDNFKTAKLVGFSLWDAKEQAYKEAISETDIKKFPTNACMLGEYSEVATNLEKFKQNLEEKSAPAIGEVSSDILEEITKDEARGKCGWNDNSPAKLTKESEELAAVKDKMTSQLFCIGTAACKDKKLMRKIASESNPDKNDSFVVYCTTNEKTCPTSMVECLKSPATDEVRALRRGFDGWLHRLKED